jgi:hypothetical protein
MLARQHNHHGQGSTEAALRWMISLCFVRERYYLSEMKIQCLGSRYSCPNPFEARRVVACSNGFVKKSNFTVLNPAFERTCSHHAN